MSLDYCYWSTQIDGKQPDEIIFPFEKRRRINLEEKRQYHKIISKKFIFFTSHLPPVVKDIPYWMLSHQLTKLATHSESKLTIKVFKVGA